MICTENFKKAPPEKQLAVINAGFACFGKNGYGKTAMSEIAAKAGVSKSLLFHYFGTKKDLFLYLYEFSSNQIIKDFTVGSDDFFECLKLGTEIKMRVMENYPHMYDFLLLVFNEKDEAIIEELKSINNDRINQARAMLFGNVDWSKFESGLDYASVIELLSWVSEGCIKKYSTIKTGREIAEKLGGYMEIMKKALYKEEYL